MAQLRQRHEEIEQLGAEVVVVGPERPDAFQRYFKTHDLPFVGLPDPGHRVLDLYGQEFKVLRLGRMPAQALVDKAGVIRFAHYGHSMSDIPEVDELLSLLRGLSEEAG